MELRPYQATAVDRMLSGLQLGKRRLLVAPTGAGKTVMGRAIVHHVVENGGRCIWMAHRRELISQAIEAIGEDMAAAICPGYLRERAAPVQVATVQTLLASPLEELPKADVIFFDEAHHFVAENWHNLAKFYGQTSHLMGATATPARADGKPLGDLFDDMVVAASYTELTAQGFLVPCRIFQAPPDLEGLAQRPLDAYLRYGQNKTGFVFCQTEKEARELAEEFTAAGIRSESVSYRTDARTRREAIGRLRTGETRLLMNVYALTEGVDVRSAEVCLLARSAGHLSIVMQMVGRVLRASPETGKTEAILIDLPGVTLKHKWLPGDDPIYSLEGKKGITVPSEALSRCEKCFAIYRQAVECPVCGHVKKPKPRKLPPIHDLELREVFAGAMTPPEAKHAAAERIATHMLDSGFSYQWADKQHKSLFEEALPEPDEAVRKKAFLRWQIEALAYGKDPKKFALSKYKEAFGKWPPIQWSSLDAFA